MFNAASDIGQGADRAFLAVAGVSAALFFVIIAFLVYFTLRYRKGRGEPEDIEGNPLLEAGLLGVSVALVLLMFYAGWRGYERLRGEAPPNAFAVRVTARMWQWSFDYGNGKRSLELQLPVGRPVKVLLDSKDVIHGFYIPAFRVKQDVMPGSEKSVWFTPVREGAFSIFCTQYCGAGHSRMLSSVNVVSGADFDAWLSKVPREAARPEGARLFKEKGCAACHTVDGAPLVGPTLKGVWGSKVRVTTDGRPRELTVDAEYIKRSELEPQADMVEGYPPIMPSQKGSLTEDEIGALIDYIKSLK